jgi:hypothetical protein
VRNSPGLPIAALLLAAAIGAIVWGTAAQPLSELQIGLTAWAFALAIYGIQGLVSVMSEGQELRPGTAPPRLTDPLSVAIVVFSLLLLLSAGLLGFGILAGWSVGTIGLAAGVGCVILALLLVFYKEAFVGEEACFDAREDGVPW